MAIRIAITDEGQIEIYDTLHHTFKFFGDRSAAMDCIETKLISEWEAWNSLWGWKERKWPTGVGRL